MKQAKVCSFGVVQVILTDEGMLCFGGVYPGPGETTDQVCKRMCEAVRALPAELKQQIASICCDDRLSSAKQFDLLQKLSFEAMGLKVVKGGA